MTTRHGSLASCLCGGYDDQLPSGVSSSQQTSLSAWSQTPGTPKFATCRVAGPAPRISTGTSSAAPYAGGSARSQRDDGSATSAPASDTSEKELSRPT